jgi:hypothetical protein
VCRDTSGSFGHAWVALVDLGTNPPDIYSRGYYPANEVGARDTSPGTCIDDSNRAATYCRAIPIRDVGQIRALVRRVEEIDKKPGTYVPGTNNCATFAGDILGRAVGKDKVKTDNRAGGINREVGKPTMSPESIEESLRELRIPGSIEF